MPSKNMLPKGKRRQTVKHDYRIARDERNEAADQAAKAAEAAAMTLDEEEVVATDDLIDSLEPVAREVSSTLTVEAAAAGTRLDAYLAKAIPDISRARAQMLLEAKQVRVDGKLAKSGQKLTGGETIEIEGEAQPAPMQAIAENIPLEIVFEDAHLAIINKPAGMMVHAGSGATEEARNRGTLVNALLYYFKDELSELGGPLRPGIVHRLDKETSGLILVAKNDKAHRALSEMFADRSVEKRYLALVHGEVGKVARSNITRKEGTVDLPIGRDPRRRTRMTTRTDDSVYMSTFSYALRHPEEKEATPRRAVQTRNAVSHWRAVERFRLEKANYTLVEVHIETGRTHQIRVHMKALGHPVVGDTLYGAPANMPGLDRSLDRNFLHAAELKFEHPITGETLHFNAPLPEHLNEILEALRGKSE